MPCAIGRGGIGVKQREGDGMTPVGTFKLLSRYSRPDRGKGPRGGSVARLNTRWSDDPQDPSYNTPRPFDRRYSGEMLRRPDRLYDLIAVTDFNAQPVVPGRGSAIFLHVWRSPRFPTAGCAAFRERDLRWILDRWTTRSRVIIQP